MERRTIEGWSLRWDENRAAQARAQGWWGEETLADLLPRLAASEPERVLLVDGAVQLTTAALHDSASRLAGWLSVRTRPGEVVSFMLPNWHEAAVVYLGATYAGLVANPILPSLRERDTRFILEDCKSRVVFAPEEFRKFGYAAMLAGIAAEMDDPPEIVTVRGESDQLARILANTPPATPHYPPADAVRMVMYTSGTTGRPKGVLHTHNSLHALMVQSREHWLVERGDAFLVPSPVSHIGGSIYAFEMPLLLGSRAVLMDQWDPAAALGLMRAERITHMAGATPFLEQLLAAAKAAGEHLPDLKVFICGGASVPPSLIEAASGWFAGTRVSRVYGSTEVPVTTVGAMETPGMSQAAYSDGRAGLAEVKLGAGDEICARGPQMLAGYLRAEDEASAFDAEGFYRSGDSGEIDGEGYLSVTGRIKDLIIRNGENIAPKEIEDLLLGHPDIAEVAVVGIPDARTGERACAVIVPMGEAQPDVAALAEFLGQLGVTRFKFPERVELRASLPRNEAGKVLKHVLRAELVG